MRILTKKRCKTWNANLVNEKPSCQKAESANFLEENSRGLRKISQKSRKGRIPKKLASKLKKLELTCTKLELKSKKTRSNLAKTPDPSISSGLKVKNKTIRVLLDSGSTGDLLFMKKRVQYTHFYCKAGCLSVVGHFQWHLCRVGNVEISFVEYLASKKVHLQPDIVEYSLGDQAPMYDHIIG